LHDVFNGTAKNDLKRPKMPSGGSGRWLRHIVGLTLLSPVVGFGTESLTHKRQGAIVIHRAAMR
jgi:hypothetical protein